MRLILFCLPVRKQGLLERKLKRVILISPLLHSVLFTDRDLQCLFLKLIHREVGKNTVKILTAQSFFLTHSDGSGSSFNCYFKAVWKQHNIVSSFDNPQDLEIVTTKSLNHFYLQYFQYLQYLQPTLSSIGSECSRKSTVYNQQ